jgi:crossover junction endodeoxyribonuclease RuvC
MIILGLDPGLANTGYGAISCDGTSPRMFGLGSLRTTPNEAVPKRLFQIHSDLVTLVAKLKPDFIAVENAFSLVKYPKAGIVLGGVIGVIYLTMFQHDLPVFEVTPREIKNCLVGSGSATKDQIKAAVRHCLSIQDISSFHAADALAVALTAYYRKSPSEIRK